MHHHQSSYEVHSCIMGLLHQTHTARSPSAFCCMTTGVVGRVMLSIVAAAVMGSKGQQAAA
jgi:hypothetical protein